MGIEIKLEQQTTEEPYLNLSHTEFNMLLPYFNQLQIKTGVVIDEYSDTKLYPEHSKFLLELIDENIGDNNINTLISLLKKSSKESVNLLFIGD